MNDEIEEIKYWLEGLDELSFNKVLDYITNLQQVNKNQTKRNSRQRLANQKQQELILKLQQEKEEIQQENERLKEDLKGQENLTKSYCKSEQDYKSRCEKAIEYIKYNDSDLYTFEPDYDYEENLIDNYEPSSFRDDLLNILQDGSEEDD